MKNILIIFILAIIMGAIIYYLAKQKKCGAKCIGCPYANECSKKTVEKQ